MYAYFDSVPACYGSAKIDFLELGLSADSSYGAAIPDLYDIPFLTNSDAHSPYPDKLGREFNRLRIRSPTAKDVLAAIRTGAVEMNAGFFPEEGKYNRTACTRCYSSIRLKDAIRHQWRCPADGGIIKKGVSDRAKECPHGGEPGPGRRMSMSSRLPRSSRQWKGHHRRTRKSARQSMPGSLNVRKRDCGLIAVSLVRNPGNPPEGCGCHKCSPERNGHLHRAAAGNTGRSLL